MEAFIHIGQQKTGSTSLQRVLEINRNRLLDDRVLYPQSLGIDKQVGLQRDWQELADPNSSLSKKLEKEINKNSKCNRTVFSEENLFVCKPIIKESLKKVMDRFYDKITIIVYLRRQEQHIPSLYQQAVKGKVSLKLDRWTKKKLNAKNNYYYYDKVLAEWERVFPSAKVIIIPFNNLSGDNLYINFLQHIGITDVSTYNFNLEKMNESIDADSIELFRIINYLKYKLNINMSEDHRGSIRDFLIANTSKKKLLLDQGKLDLIYENVIDSNRNLIAKYNYLEADKSYFLDPLVATKKVRLSSTNESQQMENMIRLLMDYFLKN